MYLMYVDESGDCGITGSPTRYFVLTGLVVHELCWQGRLDAILAFRRRTRDRTGLKLREEVHASHLISRPGDLRRIPVHRRLEIMRIFAKELAAMPDHINLISIVVDKHMKVPEYDVFGTAWRVLIQRFENTLSHKNFSGPANRDERGILLPDHTDDKKLTGLLRQMRRYNPIPNRRDYGPGYRNKTLTRIVEDPCFRDSAHSFFVQACDLSAFLLYQRLAPNTYMRKKSAHNYFQILEPILCKAASTRDPYGIVWL